MGVRKLVGHVVRNQAVPAAVLRQLGFIQEALLTDWVVDRNGRSQDMLVLSRDLDGETTRSRRPSPTEQQPTDKSPTGQSAAEENHA